MKSDAITLDKLVKDAEVYENKNIVVACYWINHVEGAWLASDNYDVHKVALSLGGTNTSWFIEDNGAELLSELYLGPTRQVVVPGTLRIGDFNGGMAGMLKNHPYIDPEVVIALDNPDAEQNGGSKGE